MLSFPIDGVEGAGARTARSPTGRARAPRSGRPASSATSSSAPQHTADMREAIVHGMLHLLGMDHETDDGEMLALQRELLAGADA